MINLSQYRILGCGIYAIGDFSCNGFYVEDRESRTSDLICMNPDTFHQLTKLETDGSEFTLECATCTNDDCKFLHNPDAR